MNTCKSLLIVCMVLHPMFGAGTPGDGDALGRFSRAEQTGRSVIVHSVTGARLRLTPYGNYMVRMQAARPGEAFLPDDRLPFIERHDMAGVISFSENGDQLTLRTAASDGVTVVLTKSNLHAQWRTNGAADPQLTESSGVAWNGDKADIAFAADETEHFAGLGHGIYGRDASPLDLRGRIISRHYEPQATLVTPWFISSKGYGVFLNCAFPSRFRFNANGHFDIEITGTDLGAQLDYVVVAGRTPLELIRRYTELTGRPRLQRKAMFGLQVSDKHHESESLAQGMGWWFDNLPKLRAAGIPVDGIIMDNTWRAGGGTWEDSIFAFDPERYSDPKAFRTWADRMGVIVDVDFNGPMYVQSEGWKPEYGIRGGQWKKSRYFYLPNFFKPEVDDWLWRLMWRNVLDPKLGYPNDMLWMDETDQAEVSDDRAPLFAGRPWIEMKNLYVLAGAKALVERWDQGFGGAKRPYIWFRTASAGLQRYCVYWSGDTQGNEADQSAQVTAMLAAGVCGMPYFNHDAGGWQSTDENIYRRYGIVAGSLSPVWRVHGIKGRRWPIEYGPDVVALAKRYSEFRYRLFPYLYSLARAASVDGTPMMQPMFVAYPDLAEAWKRDYQYLFGPGLLIAPPVADRKDVWLPRGTWTNWWTNQSVRGGQSVPVASNDDAAIFVRAGAIVPMCDFALSSAFIPKDRIELHIWVGADGEFMLYDDDGTTERYRNGEFSQVQLTWNDAQQTLLIGTRKGNWPEAPDRRHWSVIVHGLADARSVKVDDTPLSSVHWDAGTNALSFDLPELRGTSGAVVKLAP